MSFFILWNTKWEVSKKVHAALFYTMKVDEGQGPSSFKNNKKEALYELYSKSLQ